MMLHGKCVNKFTKQPNTLEGQHPSCTHTLTHIHQEHSSDAIHFVRGFLCFLICSLHFSFNFSPVLFDATATVATTVRSLVHSRHRHSANTLNTHVQGTRTPGCRSPNEMNSVRLCVRCTLLSSYLRQFPAFFSSVRSAVRLSSPCPFRWNQPFFGYLSQLRCLIHFSPDELSSSPSSPSSTLFYDTCPGRCCCGSSN